MAVVVQPVTGWATTVVLTYRGTNLLMNQSNKLACWLASAVIRLRVAERMDDVAERVADALSE